jgi:hypothetical protein
VRKKEISMSKKAYLIGFCFILSAVISTGAAQYRPQAIVKAAVGAPSAFKITVTKVEVYNGTAWIPLFSGSSQLDLVVSPGSFPNISNLAFPPATYSQLRITYLNSIIFTGQLEYVGTTYYTTSTTINDDTGSPASTTGPAQECTIRYYDWGELGAEVVRTWDIGPITVTASTDYQPILTFDVHAALILVPLGGTDMVFYLWPPEPTISEPGF